MHVSGLIEPFGLLAAVETGAYVNAWKAIPLVVMLFVWGRFATWASKDAKFSRLPQLPLNLFIMGAGIAGFGAFFLLPGFVLASLALVMSVLLPAGIYIGLRAQKQGLGDLQGEFASMFAVFKSGPRRVKELQNTVQFMDKSGGLIAAPSEDQPEYAAFVAVQSLLVQPLSLGADVIKIAPADGQMKLNYELDGYPYAGNEVERQAGDIAIELLKAFAGLDLNERRKPQRGVFKVNINGTKRDVRLETAGSSAGEAALLNVDVKGRYTRKLDEIGMSPEQENLLRNHIASGQGGITLVAAPKGQGQTSTIYALLRAYDAFLTHIQTIERAPEIELEGITQNKMAASAPPAEELKLVNWVVSQEPDVLVVSSLEDGGSAREIVAHAAKGKRAVVGIRAVGGIEALAAWRKLIGDDSAYEHVDMLVAGRLVRKICPMCKMAYEPDPASLRKMNLDPNRVQQLFQERTEPMLDNRGNPTTCDFCQEVHFKGRTGVFEVLPMDSDMRQLLQSNASAVQLRAVWKKRGAKFLQDAAFDAVASGEVSVREVMRVFKLDEQNRPAK